MSSRAETRFRIQDPNSRPRAIKVIALDAASEAVVGRLAAKPWQNATFLTAAAFPLCIICQTVLEYKSENDRNAVP